MDERLIDTLLEATERHRGRAPAAAQPPSGAPPDLDGTAGRLARGAASSGSA